MAMVWPELVPTKAARLYKYSALDGDRFQWLQMIILNSQLYFPSPAQLNDPNDVRPPLRVSSREAWLGPLLSPFLGESIDVLVREAKTISNFLKTQFLPELGGMATKVFHREMERRLVYSMTTRPDNEYLWVNYAADHSGYCLEFDKADFFATAVDVTYGDALTLDCCSSADFDGALLFYKNRKYAAEEEVRIVLLPTGRPRDVSFDPQLLRRVILGRNMRDDHKRTIREWCSQREPALLVEEETQLRVLAEQH